MENKLLNKKIIWNGDSICSGSAVDGNWATRIAQSNSMTYENYAHGGGTIAAGLPLTAKGTKRHSVCETLDLMYFDHPDADYVILEGGTNDADLLGMALGGADNPRFGTVDPNDFGGNYDETTFCGALESIFYRATKYWLGKKIGFIVAQKMKADRLCVYENRGFYLSTAASICKKWGISCVDLWNGSYLNPFLPWMYDSTKTSDQNRAENTCLYLDGQHLTSRGYDITAEIIEGWLKSL